MSKAEEFLDQALGGNHCVATLTFFALTELLNDYGKDLEADNAKLKEETIRLKLALRSIVSHKKLSLAMNTNWTKVAVEMANMAEKAYYNHPEE